MIRFLRHVLPSLLFAIAIVLSLTAPCRAAGLIVPSYFYPGTGGPGGVGDGWSAMDAAAAKVPLMAVFNPNSGPLPGPPDPNYLGAMNNLEAASGKVVAYVYTNSGNAPLASVESQISMYITQYGSLINGIYLDGMLIAPGTLSYYQSLNSYIKGLSASYLVIGNPGLPFLNGVLPASYLSTAKIFNMFEGDGSQFAAYPNGQTWLQSYPSSRFSNTIFNVPNSSLLADINKAIGLNSGYLYITDRMSPNPYDQLPSYWDQEVAAVSTPTPEADSMSLLLLGSLIAVPFTSLKR